jgi:hypothetical protein
VYIARFGYKTVFSICSNTVNVLIICWNSAGIRREFGGAHHFQRVREYFQIFEHCHDCGWEFNGTDYFQGVREYFQICVNFNEFGGNSVEPVIFSDFANIVRFV